MSPDAPYPLHGGCACGHVRYQVRQKPMFVHCCHCAACQRQTGSAFVINALIEDDAVVLAQGSVVKIATPTASGHGQDIFRCERCKVAVWSHYGAAGPAVKFLRVSTLDDPNACPPDIHIFTSAKQKWVTLPSDAVAVADYYRRSAHWPEESVARYKRAVGK